MSPVPTKLNARHRLIALLVAAGYRNTQISATLGVTEARISTIKRSGLFQILVHDIQRQFVTGTLDQVLRTLALEAGNNVAAMIEVRDHAARDSDRLSAARSLLFDGYLDRVAPVQKHEVHESTLRIQIGTVDLDRMRRTLVEDGQLAEEVQLVAPPSYAPISIEDLCEQLEQQDATASYVHIDNEA